MDGAGSREAHQRFPEPLACSLQVLCPTGGYADGGLYALDILDPSLSYVAPASLRYYHTLIKQMESWGYRAGDTLFGFPYDFR